MDILRYNREAWNREVKTGNKWTIPVCSDIIEKAKKGDWSVLLTPTIPVSKDWFGDIKGKKILCLASAGGQQGPVFAAVGADVTVLDNSTEQLKSDEMVAKRDGLKIDTQLGDMRDLSCFQNDTFDLVFHPVSNCFVDDINVVWKECYRVLKKGGALLSGFCNPLLYIFDYNEWYNDQKLVVRYSIPYSDIDQLPKEELDTKIEKNEILEFGHSLDDQIGGQLNAGFSIAGFYEDSFGGDWLDPYINTFIATKSLKM